MAEDISMDLKKTLDGVALAMAAQAEVLSKMDSRLSKAEDDEKKKKEEDDEALAKSALVKEIAFEVINMIKADQGMDVSAEPRPAKAKNTPWPVEGDAEDPAENSDLDTKTENVQRTIQASEKAAGTLAKAKSIAKAGMPTAGVPAGVPAPVPARPEDEEEEGAGEYPMNEEEGRPEDEGVEKGIYAALKAEISELRKALTSLKKSDDSDDRVKSELRKYGFREERGLAKPKLIKYNDRKPFGAETSAPVAIKKAQSSEDVVERLAQMSYRDLIQADLEARPINPEDGLMAQLASGN